jgi:protocatechuate 3,4-dioxygenase beta subunit
MPQEAAVPFSTPSLFGRRRLLLTGAAATAAGAWPAAELRAQSSGQVQTPRQTIGPFYPVDWEGDADGDLVQVTGAAAMAQGVVTHLRGRVLDVGGVPVPGAVVEIWQCDAFGRYRHPRDRQNGRDGGFQGRGGCLPRLTAAMPSGPSVRWLPGPDTAHPRGGRCARPAALVTQFYVDGSR